MSSSEYYTFLGTTCDWKCHNSVENENIFSCDNVMLDYFLAWSHIFAYFNFYKIHLVVKHPVCSMFMGPKHFHKKVVHMLQCD